MLSEFQIEQMYKRVGVEYTDVLVKKFVSGMANRMLMSSAKYGPVTADTPKRRDMMETIKLRLAKYIETHNTEFLMDIANFCVIEFTFPSFADAYFEATDSNQSPGIVTPEGEISHGRVTEKLSRHPELAD